MKSFMFPHLLIIEKHLYITYGAVIFTNRKLLKIIWDFSLDKTEVKKFVEVINNNDIDVLHLDDIIEEYMV